MSGEDFTVQCIRLLEADENDINTRGWKEMHAIATFLFQTASLIYEELEVTLSGSSAEKGKFVWADDIGDLDFMVSYKDELILIANLENIDGHPGFVKVRTQDGYLEHSTPSYLADIAKSLENENCKVTIIEKKGGPAITIDFLSSLDSPEKQYRQLGNPSDYHLILFQTLVDALFKECGAGNEEKKKEYSEELTEKLKELSPGENGNVSTFLSKTIELGLDLGKKIASLKNEPSSDHPQKDDTKRSECQHKDITQPEHSTEVQEEEGEMIDDTTAKQTPQDSSIQSTENRSIKDNQKPQDSTIQNIHEGPDEDFHLNEETDSHQEQGITDTEGKQKSLNSRYEKVIFNRLISKLPVADSFRSSNEFKSAGQYTKKIGLDIVMARKIEGWPEIANEFTSRSNRGYLTEDVMNKIRKSRIYLVTKHPESFKEDDKKFCFRYSFSQPELVIFQCIGEIQRMCYRLMKILHHTFFKKICGEESNFTSYHIKTVFFWTLERNEPDIWEMENLEVCIGLLLTNLFVALEEGKLAHYFIPNINLLANVQQDVLQRLSEKVMEIRADTQSALLMIEQEFYKITDAVNLLENEQLDQPKPTSHPTDTMKLSFYQNWPDTYDEMTAQFIRQVVGDQPTEVSYQIPNDLIELFKGSKMSNENMVKVFSQLKMTFYQKHALNMKDIQRPVIELVIEDIQSASVLLKWGLKIPEEQLTTPEYAERTLLSDLENNETDALSVIDALIPDTNEIANTFKSL